MHKKNADEFNLIKLNDCIEKRITRHNGDAIVKKFIGKNVEINMYQFNLDSVFFIDKADRPDSLKTYTLVGGKCVNLETGQILTVGDLFIVDDNQVMLNFRVIEPVLLMVHSLYSDTFEPFVEYSSKVSNILDDIQQKDSYTREHCNNVFQYTKKLALKCDLKSNEMHHLLMAARYHDVGKIFIDIDLLNKPFSLTPEEYDEIKRHVMLGEQIITEQFSPEVFEIISLHHERLDGSGYPKGLKNDEIPLTGKILAICDTYDAMTTDRVYKKGKPYSEAIAELRRLAGISLDANLIEMFIEILEQK